MVIVPLILLVFLSGSSYSEYTEPNCGDKQVIVHLFEWKWKDIAEECETYLSRKQYCGVQVSPPMEHIQGDAWWTRYQPVSYILESRSGNREEFIDMVERCNAVGVNVIADMVINHMSGHDGTGFGTAGTSYDGFAESYPGVPFSSLDFHQPYCDIQSQDYQESAYNVRNCYLVSLNDLDGSKSYVRQKIADYANDLLAIGVKGFRIDASKHMWPGDLEAIQSLFIDDIDGNRPFVFHEVINNAGEAVQPEEYFNVGKTTEFQASYKFTCLRNSPLSCLSDYGSYFIDGLHALTFVDNHDNQRSDQALTYKEDWNYKLATGFHLAHEYGFKRVMSSYAFTDHDQGPPSSTPCSDGWVCEHTWSSIANMVQFANTVIGEPVTNWQDKGSSLGFSRGSKGFFAMGDLNNVYFDTGLPDGEYCDIIHDCQQTITITNGGGYFSKAQANDPIVAICVGCTEL